MRFKYIIYPEAQQKLESSGLSARIKEAYRKHKIDIIGYISESDLTEITHTMQKEGFFNFIPEIERKEFMGKLEKTFKNRENDVFWSIARKEGEYREKIDVSDFLLFCGWKALGFLKRKELYNYEKFGFSSISEFTGSVGAMIENELHKDSLRCGLVWRTTIPDGRVFKNEITGDMNCDLRVYQTDITPYKTIDPLGNRVAYRPETEPDRRVITAYHSTEGQMLTAVLKWIEQT
ncbi:MAG: hypothetical protein AABX65_04310, partial [Nanoarchaeota archaeon]